jgi:hypothetical protein
MMSAQNIESRPDMASWLPKETDAREVYTAALVNKEIPSDGNPQYLALCKNLQELLQLLCDDPAMEPNRQQPYNISANAKSRVYDMWGFVQKTLFMALQLDPHLPAFLQELVMDVYGRSTMIQMGLLDNGKVEAAYFSNDPTPFSEVIKSKGRELATILNQR